MDMDAPATARGRSASMLVLGAAQSYAAVPRAGLALLEMAESWRGADPTTLGANMREIQSVKWRGAQYFLIATRDRLDIAATIEGGGIAASLRFDPASLAWYAEAGPEKAKLAEWADESRRVLTLIRPDGTRVAVRP
ncbi:MAG TPA: hypothetical protein VJ385_02030 [Fibrobacteria bacterium]|nr:hypothetical protein [Fibrobacteria bacterium]